MRLPLQGPPRSFWGCDDVWLSPDKVWFVLWAHRRRPTTCRRPLLAASALSGYQAKSKAKWILIGVSLKGKGNAICTLRGFQLRQSLGSTDRISKHVKTPLLKQLLYLIPSLLLLIDLFQKLGGKSQTKGTSSTQRSDSQPNWITRCRRKCPSCWMHDVPWLWILAVGWPHRAAELLQEKGAHLMGGWGQPLGRLWRLGLKLWTGLVGKGKFSAQHLEPCTMRSWWLLSNLWR